jgi:hypothetical protein
MQSRKPLRVAFTYRTEAAADRHLLQIRVDQPTRGLTVTLDYGDTDVEYINVLDFIASGERAVVHRRASSLPDRPIDIDFDGWVSRAPTSRCVALRGATCSKATDRSVGGLRPQWKLKTACLLASLRLRQTHEMRPTVESSSQIPTNATSLTPTAAGW